MPTPHTKYRFGPETLAALDRIAARISACRGGERVTTAAVIRWLAALHDPAGDPCREYTPEEVSAFPRVYSDALRRAAATPVVPGVPTAPVGVPPIGQTASPGPTASGA